MRAIDRRLTETPLQNPAQVVGRLCQTPSPQSAETTAKVIAASGVSGEALYSGGAGLDKTVTVSVTPSELLTVEQAYL